MVRTRRPATNSVIRRMLRPLIVTRKDREPQRACVRSRAEADAACVPATPAAGWFGAAVVTGVGAGAGAAGCPATLLFGAGFTHTPFCSTCPGWQPWLLTGGWQTPSTTVFGGWHSGLFGGWQTPSTTVFGGWHSGLFGGWQTPSTTVSGGSHSSTGTQLPSFSTSPGLHASLGSTHSPSFTTFGGLHSSTAMHTPSFLTSPSLQTGGGCGQFCAWSSFSSCASCSLPLLSRAL